MEKDEFIVKVCLSWQVVYGLFFGLPCTYSGERAPFQLSWVTCNEGKYRQDDDCAVGEVDLRQLRGDVMDMIVQFLRWDRAETERGCYGVILPILVVAASARISSTLERILSETIVRGCSVW